MRMKFPNRRKIDEAYWSEILASPAKAREALVNLQIEGRNGKPKNIDWVGVRGPNGEEKKIPVSEVSEEQAYEFMCSLCPTWAKN